MGFYDAMKDALNLAQKADNIELYRQLLDLQAQALDLQAENSKLKGQISELQTLRDIEKRITRHQHPYLTLIDDEIPIKYCAVCWDSDQKLIQMNETTESIYSASWRTLQCHKCHNRCRLDGNG